jgi:hypothetical protein
MQWAMRQRWAADGGVVETMQCAMRQRWAADGGVMDHNHSALYISL